jgi:hypothetical protein
MPASSRLLMFEYPENHPAGSLERIGDWAYLHE